MSKTQLTILWIGIGIFVLMGLFPPYLMFESQRGDHVSAGYRFILDRGIQQMDASEMSSLFKHLSGKTVMTLRIDAIRLFVQWTIVMVITAGLIYTLRDKKV